MRIAIGSDHAGFDLKEELRRFLQKNSHQVDDCGTFDRQSNDYPKIAVEVARRVADGRCDRGIIIDGAGIGSAMAANKVPGVRAALCYDVSTARNSREHNDANVLTLGARLIGPGLAEQIVETWLGASCTEERHQRRVAMITEIEQGGLRGPEATEAPAESKTTGDRGLDPLSTEDLQRVAERIRALLDAQGLGWGEAAPCACCGPTCVGHCAERGPDAVRNLVGLGAGRIVHRLGGAAPPGDLASYIDHTALKPETTADDVRKLCAEAREHSFASVCINPCFVRLAAEQLKGCNVRVCSVVGFPLGATTPELKALEARRAIREGAREIDMVINVGALKGRDDALVYRDIRAVVEACEDGRALCKVIIEAALLSDEEKVRACLAAKRARADFVKTSTGFGPGGATAHDVALMAHSVAGTGMGVKAAGGIRSLEDAQKMIAAGATRIGASAGVKIVKEALGGPSSGGELTTQPGKY